MRRYDIHIKRCGSRELNEENIPKGIQLKNPESICEGIIRPDQHNESLSPLIWDDLPVYIPNWPALTYPVFNGPCVDQYQGGIGLCKWAQHEEDRD